MHHDFFQPQGVMVSQAGYPQGMMQTGQPPPQMMSSQGHMGQPMMMQMNQAGHMNPQQMQMSQVAMGGQQAYMQARFAKKLLSAASFCKGKLLHCFSRLEEFICFIMIDRSYNSCFGTFKKFKLCEMLQKFIEI